MTSNTVWSWISSNGWPLLFGNRVAIKYFYNDLPECLQTFNHSDISLLANRISEQISNLNIREQLVLIDSDEALLSVPFILGILQSSNAFFIVDPNWPEKVLRNYIEKLKPSLFICRHGNKASTYDSIIINDATKTTSITSLNQQIDFIRTNHECHYEDIVYVVASSGSTGIPKLIFVSHACIIPNLDQLKTIFDVEPNDCLFRSTPLTFDPALVDIFLAVHCGACLCILSNDIRHNPTLTSALFEKSSCTIAQMTPSFFRQINTRCNMLQLKTLILGGEKFPHLSNVTLQQMLKQNKRVINIYGLTEMSCWASYYKLSESDLEKQEGIPLGNALNETSLFLKPYVDYQSSKDYFQIVLESRTRWTKTERLSSVKKFIFETDDLVYCNRSHGQIFYVGRKTLTQKRFGIMINLEYIEQIAHQSNLLDECACVTLKEDENLLILLCKFKANSQPDRLHTYLKSNLSRHFIPNLILPVQSDIPLNANGKIDRSKLNELYLTTIKCSSKNSLMDMWQNLLNKLPDGESNFIFHGGNSLQALTLVEQVKQLYSFIDPNLFYDLILHKTFDDLINYIGNPQAQQSHSVQHVSSSSSTTIPRERTELALNSVWSIHRCSKIFRHRQNLTMDQYNTFPEAEPFSGKRFVLNWKCSMSKCIDASPLIVLLDENRQLVIVGSHAGLINAYQIDSGELIWSFHANDRIEASGTISQNGRFFLVGDYSGTLYVIECADGHLFSSYQCQGLIKSVPGIHQSTGMVYLGAHDQYIHAIEIQETSSRCVWKFGLNGSCVSSPQLSADGSRLYVACLSGDVFTFESSDGRLLWNKSLEKPIFSTMAIWNDRYLLIGCVDQRLYCLDCHSGQQKWTFLTNGPIFSSPCIFGDIAFMGCHNQYLYAINISSERAELRWKCFFPSMVYASPFVCDHGRVVMVGSTDGCFRLLHTLSGETIAETSVAGNGLFSSPVSYRDFVVVGSRDDHLYAFKLLP